MSVPETPVLAQDRAGVLVWRTCNVLEVPMSRPKKSAREKMSEWVLHCAVNQRHIRRSQPSREAALRDACSQLLEGHAVKRIIGA
jgi:hypothetical protein